MGLDIYFEKRKRDFDFTAINKMRKERKEVEEKMDKVIGDGDSRKVFNVVWKLIDGEDVSNEPIEVVQLAEQIAPLHKEYERLESEIEAANPRKEVAYFRKVNLLMVFFDYEGNCEYKVISQGEIEDLIDRCNRVLADHELAEILLPTTEGFFFGSTDYDEWYFRDVEEVRDTFQKILDETNFGNEVVEMYAWY